MAQSKHYLEDMTTSYLETLLWNGTDGEEPLDENYAVYDLAPAARAAADTDCSNFIDLIAKECPDAFDKMDAEQMGYDFALTRNHNGVGFWDRGLGDVGDCLTKWAHTFGEASLYIGDDNAVYYEG